MSDVKKIEKPWGYELIWALSDHYSGKILVIEKGKRLSYQYHNKKDETIYLQKGLMDFEYAAEGKERTTVRLKPGDVFHITTGLRHRMQAVETCEVLEVSTPELDDVVRLEDDYKRT